MLGVSRSGIVDLVNKGEVQALRIYVELETWIKGP